MKWSSHQSHPSLFSGPQGDTHRVLSRPDHALGFSLELLRRCDGSGESPFSFRAVKYQRTGSRASVGFVRVNVFFSPSCCDAFPQQQSRLLNNAASPSRLLLLPLFFFSIRSTHSLHPREVFVILCCFFLFFILSSVLYPGNASALFAHNTEGTVLCYTGWRELWSPDRKQRGFVGSIVVT